MRASRPLLAVLPALAGLLLAGCGGVEFDHPLSDEKTSTVDERLIGVWEPTRETLGTGEYPVGTPLPRLAVGRDPKHGNLMEAVSLEVDDDGYVIEKRMSLAATKIGAHVWLSVRDAGENQRWWVVRYDLPEEHLLRIWLLDVEAFAKAVEAGELQGEVKRPEEGAVVTDTSVRVSSKPAAVRAWLEAHAASCVRTETAEMRRVVMKHIPKPPSDEGADEEHDAEGE